jgi:hypothetical protein
VGNYLKPSPFIIISFDPFHTHCIIQPDEAGSLMLVADSSCEITQSAFRESEAAVGGVMSVDDSWVLTVADSMFIQNVASSGDSGVFKVHGGGSLTVSESAFVENTAVASGGVFSGAGDVTNSNFSRNSATEGNGGVALVSSGSSFDACTFLACAAAPNGKGALFYSTASLSIVSSSIGEMDSPNSEFIIDHEPGMDTTALVLNRVVFENNAIRAVHSTVELAVVNCPGLSNNDSDVDVANSDLLMACASEGAGEFCNSDHCSVMSLMGGIGCYCYPNGIKTDPFIDSCLTAAQIYVPERDLTIRVRKPDKAVATLTFLNKGDGDLEYEFRPIGSSSSFLWAVAPSSGRLTRDEAVQTVIFTLGSTQLQARASEYTTKFSLLSNSLDEADRNLTIVTNLLVSAEPSARLSNVTLTNPSDVVAGDSLSFYLALVDLTHIEILDAFDGAYSAVLTHLDSAENVPCSVLYDTKSERHQGGCELPSLVCTNEGASTTTKCEELSPPVGEFVLEVNGT